MDELVSKFDELDCISREDALMCLTGEFENRQYEPSELVSIFSKRIKHLPSVTPQPCEDAVSKQAVLELIADDDLSMGQVVRGIHALPTVTPQEPRVDFKELKRKILMEVDGGTDDAWLAYGEVCDRISNAIDEFVSDMRGKEE